MLWNTLWNVLVKHTHYLVKWSLHCQLHSLTASSFHRWFTIQLTICFSKQCPKDQKVDWESTTSSCLWTPLYSLYASFTRLVSSSNLFHLTDFNLMISLIRLAIMLLTRHLYLWGLLSHRHSCRSVLFLWIFRTGSTKYYPRCYLTDKITWLI